MDDIDDSFCFCSLSGNTALSGTDDFIYELLDVLDDLANFNDPEAKWEPKVLQSLKISPDDVDASNDLIMLSPFEERNGENVLLCTYEAMGLAPWASLPRPTQFSEKNITLVFDVRPGNSPTTGEYVSADGSQSYCVLQCIGNTFIMMHSSYLILKQVCPTIQPHQLYQIFDKRRVEDLDNGVVEGIDYGVVGKTHDSGVVTLTEIVEEYISRGVEWDVSERWDCIFEATDEEVVRDVKLGKGNMWVFSRPDRFPIQEAAEATPLPILQVAAPALRIVNPAGASLTNLPHDVYQTICQFMPFVTLVNLLSTSKVLYAILHPHIDYLSYTCLRYQQPYYLPGSPVPCLRGDMEMNFWNAEWKKAGYGENASTESANLRIPWFRYARACHENCSMKNRKRIWGIAEQIRDIAREEGLVV